MLGSESSARVTTLALDSDPSSLTLTPVNLSGEHGLQTAHEIIKFCRVLG